MLPTHRQGCSSVRRSAGDRGLGKQIPASQARPGDLVFFAGSDGTMTAPGHVGIVIAGHDLMIDAPATGLTVTRQSFAGSTDLVGFTRP
jgi:cell wall-associated NlpC family hydrolase